MATKGETGQRAQSYGTCGLLILGDFTQWVLWTEMKHQDMTGGDARRCGSVPRLSPKFQNHQLKRRNSSI